MSGVLVRWNVAAKVGLALLLGAWAGRGQAQTQLPPVGPDAAFQILVFSKTAGYRHAAIGTAVQALATLGRLNNFGVVATEDASVFTDESLARFQAVVFLLTSGDVLNAAQQAAFERFIQSGRGFVGVHSAADTEYSWPWFGGLLGAHFADHPPITSAVLRVEDAADASTAFLPASWTRSDEWFNYSRNPRPDVHVLLTLDESTYAGGTMGDHPISWRQAYDGGRAWYTGLGHAASAYAEPWFRLHLLGGIRYAAGVPLSPPRGARVLFDGSGTSHWVQSNTHGPSLWPVQEGALTVNLAAGGLETVETYRDCRVHVEFQLPTYAPGTVENDLPNSGIFLQGRYEIQMMSTYGRAVAGNNESGAIWGIRNPTSNASVPDTKWETFDLLFQAPRWSGAVKTQDARVTVYWNTVLVQSNVPISKVTSASGGDEQPSAGPMVLQALKREVRFRNIWVLGDLANPPSLAARLTGSGLELSWPAVPDGFELETKATLSGDLPWHLVPAVPVTANGLQSVVVPPTDTSGVFRLREGGP